MAEHSRSLFFNDDARKEVLELGNDKVHQIMEILSTPATEILAGLPSPMFVKTHLPMSLLPPTLLDTAKVAYVARDPRDVAVSSYHHARLFTVLMFKGTFKQLWDAFRKDLCKHKLSIRNLIHL